MDWLDLLAVQGTLKSLLQHHSSKVSVLRHSAFFTVQVSHPYMTIGKTIALTRRTFVGKVMSLVFNMLSRLVMTFLPRSKHLLISWLQSPSFNTVLRLISLEHIISHHSRFPPHSEWKPKFLKWFAKPYTICSCYFSDLLSSHSLCSSHAGHLTVHPTGLGSLTSRPFPLLSFHQEKLFAQIAIQVSPSLPSGFIVQMPALTTLPHSGTPNPTPPGSSCLLPIFFFSQIIFFSILHAMYHPEISESGIDFCQYTEIQYCFMISILARSKWRYFSGIRFSLFYSMSPFPQSKGSLLWL